MFSSMSRDLFTGSRPGSRSFFSVWLACLLSLPVSAFAADIEEFYAATGAEGAAGYLYSVVPDTGEMRFAFHPAEVSAVPMGIHAMAISPDGEIYAVTTRFGPSQRLLRINPYSGDVHDFGELLVDGINATTLGLAFDGATLYGYQRNNTRLFTIDTATGDTTAIGGADARRGGLAINSDGDFYTAGTTLPDIFTVNPATGVTALVGTVSEGLVNSRIRSMVFDADDTLYALDCPRPCIAPVLVTIDLVSLEATPVMTLSGPILAITSGLFADDDEDGLPDAWEVAFGFDPAVDNAAGDEDDDGLSNAEEYAWRTDPTNPDTDGDGLSDGDEVNVHGTDPGNADTDGDGIPDGTELAIDLDPLDRGDGVLTSHITISGSEYSAIQPHAVVDGDGNRHVVWSQDMVGDENSDDLDIHYAMFSADWETLIAPTRIADVPNRDMRSAIGLSPDGSLHVVWQNSGNDAWFARLDPSQAAADGSAADPDDLVVDGPVVFGTQQHLSIAVDSEGNAHVSGKASGSCDPASYVKLDPAGTVLIGPINLTTRSECHPWARLALDDDDNVHIVWNDDDISSTDALRYAMLDGSDGSFLIAPSLMTEDNGRKLKHSDIHRTEDGGFFITWVQQQEGGGDAEGDVRFAKIDPSLHDQDGSTASFQQIATIEPTTLHTGEPFAWYPSSGLDVDGNLIVTWIDNAGGSASPHSMMVVGNDGTVRSRPVPISTTGSAGPGNSHNVFARVLNDGVLVSERAGSITSVFFRGVNIANPVAESASGAVSISQTNGNLLHFNALSVTDLPQAAQDSIPEGLEFPDGLARLVIGDIGEGDSVVVTLTFPSEVPDTAVYYKWNAFDGWYPVNFAASPNPNQIRLILTDGGEGDADGVANGFIADPGGWGLIDGGAPVTTVTVRGSGGGGCAMTLGGQRPDPFFLIILLLAVGALWRRQTRRAH